MPRVNAKDFGTDEAHCESSEAQRERVKLLRYIEDGKSEEDHTE